MNKNKITDWYCAANSADETEALDQPDTWGLVIDWMQDLDTHDAELVFSVNNSMTLETVELIRVRDQLYLALPDGSTGTELPAAGDPLDLCKEIAEQEARS